MWCLDININKTKTIIFNKSGKLLNYNFNFNGKSIKNVHTYKYLGVLFSDSGTFSHAKLDLYNRGLKAFFKLKSISVTFQPKYIHAYIFLIIPLSQFYSMGAKSGELFLPHQRQ